MTLLEKAKNAVVLPKPGRKGVTRERVDLAVAWLAGEITNEQAAAALDLNLRNKRNMAALFGPALQIAWHNGLIGRK